MGVVKSEFDGVVAQSSENPGRSPGASDLASECSTVEGYLAKHPIADRDRIGRLLAALPSLERTAIILKFGESLTHTEIAGRLGTTRVHVSRLLSQSLASLRDQLE